MAELRASNSRNYRKSSKFNITKGTKQREGLNRPQKEQIFYISSLKMLAGKNCERRKQLHPRCYVYYIRNFCYSELFHVAFKILAIFAIILAVEDSFLPPSIAKL